MSTFPEALKRPCSADAPIYLMMLPGLRAGTLSPPELEALRAHLVICAPCRDQAIQAVDRVIENGVRRHYGVPADTAPFLTLDAIRQRISSGGTDEAYTTPREPVHEYDGGKIMGLDDNWPEASAPPGAVSRPPIKPPNRWRAAAAVVATVAIISLFALLLRGFVAGNGAANPAGTSSTSTISATTTTPALSTHGQWHVIDAMSYTTQVFTQTPYPAFSPMDPTIVYETTLNPITVRRSDDGGATWQALDLPRGSDQAIDIEIFPSPLEAHTAFLTVTVNLAYGQGTNGCPSSARASVGGATHGGILASGQVPCGTTYRTTDEGQNWKAISFPVNGTISTPLSDSAPYAGAPIQAQGTRLYALLSCGPSCVSPGSRLATSADGGVTWHAADGGGLGQGVCDFAAQPDNQTVYAAVSNGSCDVLNSPQPSLYRSNNAGTSWADVGILPKAGAQAQSAVQGMAAVTVGGKAELVVNLPVVTWQPHIIGVEQTADEFHVSVDGGHTWITSPLKGVPDKALPVVGPLIVRADGSLVVSFTTNADQGQAAKLYTWKPGEASWQVLAPAPEGHTATLLYTISPTGVETFWAVIRAGTSSTGLTTFSVASYQP